MKRRAGMRTGIVLLVALVAAVAFAAVGRADDPRFDQVDSSLGPNIVNSGATVLYKAQWHYIDNQTLTHASVVITVPAGWTLVSPSDPTGCTQAQAGAVVTCDRGTLRQGDFVKQAVELTATASTVPVTQTVASSLNFYEGPPNPGRAQSVPAPNRTTTVISADQTVEPNRAGKCLDQNETVSTAAGVGGSSSSARGPFTLELCTPVSLVENARANPNDACLPAPYECVTDIVTTDAPVGSTANPIKLTLIFYGTNLSTLPLIFSSGTTRTVPACPDPATAVPDDPCYFGHVARMRSVTWSVNWSGVDPGWTS
jgi:hypothetical protein